ncbi:thiamine-binding protein [Kangiella spongicola]|nr:thiamine-binding protein [Kangiella spongicola]
MMRISVELSLYPLDDKFLPIIQDIVERITGDKRVEAIVNTMSTQIFGDFESVMAVVNETVEYSFRTYGKQVFVAKFLNSDVKPD